MDKEIKQYLAEIEKTVGERIAYTRLKLGMTRKVLAAAIDISEQQLHKYESGKNRISIGRLYLVAKKLNKRMFHFLPD